MENLINIVVGGLTIVGIFWSIFFPRISKALGYGSFPIIPKSQLDPIYAKLSKGKHIYIHHIVLLCFGKDPVDSADIDRHPSIEYKDEVEILDVKIDDKKNISPEIEYNSHKMRVKTRWNPGDKLMVHLIIASPEKPEKPIIDARIMSSYQFSSRQLSKRYIHWIEPSNLRAFIIYGVIILGILGLTNWVDIHSAQATSIASLPNAIVIGFFIGSIIGLPAIIPLAIFEIIVFQVAAHIRGQILYWEIKRKLTKEGSIPVFLQPQPTEGKKLTSSLEALRVNKTENKRPQQERNKKNRRIGR